MQITVKVENLAVSVRSSQAKTQASKSNGSSKLTADSKSVSVSVSGSESESCKSDATRSNGVGQPEAAAAPGLDQAGRRLLLDGICAYVKPGQLMAVMGASGCGKTTFLSALSGRQGASAGQLLFNGQQLSKSLRRQICYVLQNDVFFANLSLRQTLEYTALLRLPDSLGRAGKMRKVDEIIEALDLKSCEQTLVGDFSTAGLSGGQKKRLSIACELLSNPAVMLLDEPTSSLDSCTALNLMKLLKQYALREQKTIIISIHQPASQIFYMFDKLLLLSRGQMLYFGSPAQAMPFFNHFNYHLEHLSYNPADYLLEISKQMDDAELAKISLAARSTFFASHKTNSSLTATTGLTSGCQSSAKSTASTLSAYGSMSRLNSPMSHNQDAPAKTSQHQISHQFVSPCDPLPSPSPPSQAVSILDPRHPHHHHNSHHYHQEHHHFGSSLHGSMSKIYMGAHEADCHFDCASSTEGGDLDQDLHDSTSNQPLSRQRNHHEWPSSFSTQVCALTSRNFIECKARVLSKLNWIQTVGMALISGAMWFQLARTEDSLEDVKGWIYFSTVYWMMVSLFSTLATIPQESQVISKERLGGYYRLSAYYVAKMIAELPLIVALPSVYHMISYPMLGLYSLQTFFAMWLMVILNSVAAQSVGILIGYSFKRIDISLTVASLYSTSTMLFAGFYAKNIPHCLSWYRFLSLIYYGFLNMQLVEFTTGPPIMCAIKNSKFPSCHHARPNSTNQVALQSTGPFSPNKFVDPDEVLWGLDRFRPSEAPTPFWFNTLCLVAFLLVFRFLGYLVLRSCHKPT